jgi:hypothetical protein
MSPETIDLEIALERFFFSGNKADMMITYRTPRQAHDYQGKEKQPSIRWLRA